MLLRFAEKKKSCPVRNAFCQLFSFQSVKKADSKIIRLIRTVVNWNFLFFISNLEEKKKNARLKDSGIFAKCSFCCVCEE